MGSYTKGLFKKNRPAKVKIRVMDDITDHVHIVCCALERDGTLHQGFKSHAEIRRTLGDEDPYESKKSDTHGFMTSQGVFVSRHRATAIAHAAGQTDVIGRELLSNDITKWPT